MKLTGIISEKVEFDNERDFINYINRFLGLKKQNRERILENQNARFKKAQELNVPAEYLVSAKYIPIFGAKFLIQLNTTLLTHHRTFEEKREIAMAAKHKTAVDYRAAGYID